MREHAQVRASLPQRYPMLLVDRVLDIVPGRSIRAIKSVTGTEPCYAGLPEDAEPWRYDYPRSLIIESFGQSAALLWLAGTVPTADDAVRLMFVHASNFRFTGAARPGDVLRHEVRLDSVIADTAFASGRTFIDDRIVSTVDCLVATRRPVRGAGAPLPGGAPVAAAGLVSTDAAGHVNASRAALVRYPDGPVRLEEGSR